MQKIAKFKELELKNLILSQGAKEFQIGTLHRYLVNVTPDLASNLLLNNILNRDIRQKQVDKLVNEIKNGDFKKTHNAIAFDNEGILLDGQHRLKAIVESQTPLELEIVFGLDSEARTVVDTGAMRTGGDIITIADLQEGNDATYANQKSATVKRILNLGFDRNVEKLNSKKYKNTEIMAFYKDNEMLSYVAKQAVTAKFKLISPSVLAAAWYLIAKTEQKATNSKSFQETEIFFEKLISGIGLEENSHIYRLRKFFEISQGSKNKNDVTDSYTLIETWNKYRKHPEKVGKNFARVTAMPDEIVF